MIQYIKNEKKISTKNKHTHTNTHKHNYCKNRNKTMQKQIKYLKKTYYNKKN